MSGREIYVESPKYPGNVQTGGKLFRKYVPTVDAIKKENYVEIASEIIVISISTVFQSIFPSLLFFRLFISFQKHLYGSTVTIIYKIYDRNKTKNKETKETKQVYDEITERITCSDLEPRIERRSKGAFRDLRKSDKRWLDKEGQHTGEVTSEPTVVRRTKRRVVQTEFVNMGGAVTNVP